METAAYELHQALAVKHNVRLLRWGKSDLLLNQKLLREVLTILFYPFFFIKSLALAWFNRPDVIYLQDGVLAPVGVVLQAFARRSVVITIHGLDVTYNNRLYQAVFRWSLKRLAGVAAVSQATKDEVIKRTGRQEVAVINNGVNDNFYINKSRAVMLDSLAKETGLDAGRLKGSKLLLTSGRLVKRKGVYWFCDQVIPNMKGDFLYLVSGDGPDKDRLAGLVVERGLEDKVKLLGYVSDAARRLLYNCADLFIMPSIPVAGDPEGFGIVAIEASSCGTPVVAANLGGIGDAVIDERNGWLVKSEAADKFQIRVDRELSKPSLKRSTVRDFTLKTFSWTKAADEYASIMRELVK